MDQLQHLGELRVAGSLGGSVKAAVEAFQAMPAQPGLVPAVLQIASD